MRLGLDIVLHRFGRDDGVDCAVKPAGEVLFPVVIGDVVETERRVSECETVRGELALGVKGAQPHPLLLADLHQQRLLPLAGRPGQRLGSDLRLDPGQLEAFVDQLGAVAVKVEQPAAQHQQGQDVHRQDSRRQTQPALRDRLFAAARCAGALGLSHR